MFQDPLTTWNGAFPYDVLRNVGVTPASTVQQVKDASFDLMEQGGMTPEARQAWDELRFVSRRLFVDFFLYQIDVSAVANGADRQCVLAPTDWETRLARALMLASDPSAPPGGDQEVSETPIVPQPMSVLPELDGTNLIDPMDAITFDS